MVIDVTDLAEKIQTTFVTWSVDTVFALTVAQPYMSWVGWPGISTIYRAFLNWLFSKFADQAAMQAFFLNTAIRKNGEADDFVSAVNFKNALPEDVSDEKFAEAEKAEIAAFNSLVTLTR